MAIPATLKYWHKMEGEVNPETGPATTWNGVIHAAAAKFNNGLRGNDAAADYGTFATNGVWPTNGSAEQGCIEFWFHPLVASGVPWNATQFQIGNTLGGPVASFGINSAETLAFYCSSNNRLLTKAGASWAANSDHHIAVVWDKAGIDGGANTQRIYWDGVSVATGNLVLGFTGTWSVLTYILAFTAGVANCTYQALVDNLKIWDYAKTDFSDRDTEGYTDAPETKKIRTYEIPEYTPPAPTPVLFAPVRSRVEIIGDTDIYELGLIDNIGNIAESRSFRKDKMIDNEIRIPVDNKALAFSPGNSKSLFNGTNWYFSQVKIWDEDNIKIWDGLLWDIIRNSQSRTASLVSRSVMSRIKNIKVVYESSAYETGADALMNIFDAAEFTNYNQRTFQESAATLTAAGALMYLRITAEDNMSMQNIIEKVAEYCAADAYGHLGEIYLKVWKKITASGSVPIVEKDILKQPVTQSAMSEIINTYSIGYSGDEGTPATDENNNDVGSVSRRLYGTRSLPELSTGDEGQIVFPTLASAVWIGEQYIKRTHRNIDTTPLPLIMSSLSVDGRLRNFIDLESILGLTYSDEGFSNETMEPFKFVRNNDRNIVDLILYTAAS